MEGVEGSFASTFKFSLAVFYLDETLVAPNIALVQIVYVRYSHPGITPPPVNSYPQIIIYFIF